MIELKELSFKYNGSSFSLSGINLQIKEGEFISVLGPNGSGKSTLLKLIGGFLKPFAGEVKISGVDVRNISPKERAKRIAYVPQNTITSYPFTVYEIVAMGRAPYLGLLGYERENDSAVIRDAMERMGIASIADKPITGISGGEMQRAFIARALAQEPEVILLDEANAHLDVKHQISIYKTLKELNEEKKTTVIFVSHDFNLPARFSERAVLLEKGKIFADDKIKNVLTAENIFKVFGVKSVVLKNEESVDILLRD